MTDIVGEQKLLGELRVTELKQELEKRNLDKNGIKIILADRLEKFDSTAEYWLVLVGVRLERKQSYIAFEESAVKRLDSGLGPLLQ
ncbi:hypothetical protein Q1695_010409 [Nippostrongylus brasiliensis]|nr:hypothetical protein Q1695_010409 [Nippostrongylus brasiliensis]